MLFGLPLTFSQKLYAGRIDEQMQPFFAGYVVHLNIQVFLPAADRTEVRRLPWQARQLDEGLNQANGLA